MASTETKPLVIITSVFTETVRPTLLVTESTVITPEPVHTQMVHTQLASTSTDNRLQSTPLDTTHPTPVLQQTTQLNAILPTSTSNKTSPLPVGEQNTSRSTEHEAGFLGHFNISTSTSDLIPALSVSSSSSTLGSSPTITFSASLTTTPSSVSTIPPSDIRPYVTRLTSVSISPSHLPTSSLSDSLFNSATSAPGAVQDSSTSHKDKSLNVGAIIGGTIGGATFVALSLLTCIYLSRRKRQTGIYGRRNSNRSLLHPRTGNQIRPSHKRQISEPVLPSVESPAIPSAPVFPARSYSTPDGVRPGFLSVPFDNDDASLRTNFQNEEDHRHESPFRDPENPLISASLEVFPPSRSESMYSKSSWGSRSKLLERQDGFLRSSPYESLYYPGESTLTLPRGSVGPDSSTTNKNRASTRSDPFDLEAPPDILPQWPL